MNEEKTGLPAVIEKAGIKDQTKAQYLLDNFSDAFEFASGWEKKAAKIIVTDESQLGMMERARAGRLELKAKRIEIEKARKTLKEQALREGKAIDGIANVLKALIVPLEEDLADKEKFAERKAAAEAAARAEAAEEALREKEELERVEREAAEAEERARIAKENEKLKAEAEAQKAELEKERKKLEAVEKKQAAEKKKRLKAEADAKAETIAKERAEADAAKAEREKVEAIERAEREKKEAEERERKEHDERRLKAEHTVSCPECGHRFDTRGE